VDVEDCLKSMEFGSTFTGRKRKVLLASAIADSSITIPNVTCVIDTCRALEVNGMHDDPNRMCLLYGRDKQFATNGGDEQEGLAMAKFIVSSTRVFTTTTWKSGSSRS